MNIKEIIFSGGEVLLPEKVRKTLLTDIMGNTKKTFYISGWSVVHLITGIIFGYLYIYLKYDIRFYFYNMFILHTLWEILQTLVGIAKPYKLTGGNNLIDSIIDTIIFMFGAYIVRKILILNNFRR
jgi:hypothetical protein